MHLRCLWVLWKATLTALKAALQDQIDVHQPFTMKLDYYKGIHICIITCLIFVIMLYPPQNVSSNFIIKPHLLYCLLNYSKNKIWSTSLKQGHKEKAWVVKDYLMRWRTALPFQIKGITMSSHTSQIQKKKKRSLFPI